MTTSLGKRSSVNGISDIAYSDEKAPVYTSTNQFVQGTKTFNAPINALSNVLCSGFYYGDGSHLTNLPIINDPSKLPLAGGTMTGPIVMSLNPAPVVVNTLTHEHVEITDAIDQVVAIGFVPGTITDPKVYLQNGVNTNIISALNIDITTPGVGNNYLTTTGGSLFDSVGSCISTNTVDRTEYFNPSVHSGTYCRAGSTLSTNWSGLDVRTGSSSEYSASLGFSSSFGQNPIVQLTTPTDNTELGASALIYTNLNPIGPYQENFKLKADDNFFKFDCGSSYRIREHDGIKVKKDDAIIVTPSSYSNYDFAVYDSYLDSNGLGGFSVIIIHPGSVTDPTINTPDLVFVGSQIGVTTNFTLPKWTIARFILTPTDPAIGYPNNFVWMVSW
jgi:hypothetical protein